jgi:hypothetical protein
VKRLTVLLTDHQIGTLRAPAQVHLDDGSTHQQGSGEARATENAIKRLDTAREYPVDVLPLLYDAARALQEEVDAAGHDEVRQHPILSRHSRIEARLRNAIARLEKQR